MNPKLMLYVGAVGACAIAWALMKPKLDRSPAEKWSWISREVEQQMMEVFREPDIILHVKGRRRVGKSETTLRALKASGRAFIKLAGHPDSEIFFRAANKHIDVLAQQYKNVPKARIKDSSDAVRVLSALIDLGIIVVVEEFHQLDSTSSHTFFEIAEHIRQVDKRPGGGLVLLGSYEGVDAKILASNKSLFYARVTNTVTISPFNSHEMCRVFKQFNIDNSYQMLNYYALSGGMPCILQILAKRDKLTNNADISSIVNTLFASQTQLFGKDALNFLAGEVGNDCSQVLKALYNDNCDTVKKQIENINSALKWNDSQKVQRALDVLHKKYNVITEEKSMLLPSHSRYVIQDKLLLLALLLDRHRRIFTNADDSFCREALSSSNFKREWDTLRGRQFEQWMRTTIRERSHEMKQPFPHPDMADVNVTQVYDGFWKTQSNKQSEELSSAQAKATATTTTLAPSEQDSGFSECQEEQTPTSSCSLKERLAKVQIELDLVVTTEKQGSTSRVYFGIVKRSLTTLRDSINKLISDTAHLLDEPAKTDLQKNAKSSFGSYTVHFVLIATEITSEQKKSLKEFTLKKLQQLEEGSKLKAAQVYVFDLKDMLGLSATDIGLQTE